MKNIERINELQTRLDSFAYNGELQNVLTISAWIILAVLLAINLYLRLKDKDSFVPIVLAVLVFVIGSVFMIVIGEEIEVMNKELDVLLQENVSEFTETTSIETVLISNRIPVEDRYCPQVELDDSERCTYIEFSSEGEITQIFIPLNKAVLASEKAPLRITYYELSDEVRDQYNQKFDIEHLWIKDKYQLYENGWSFGQDVSLIEAE